MKTSVLFCLLFSLILSGCNTTRNNDWILAQKADAVICGAKSQTVSNRKNDKQNKWRNHVPSFISPIRSVPDKNNCSHMTGAAMLCSLAEHKRRFLKVFIV